MKKLFKPFICLIVLSTFTTPSYALLTVAGTATQKVVGANHVVITCHDADHVCLEIGIDEGGSLYVWIPDLDIILGNVAVATDPNGKILDPNQSESIILPGDYTFKF